ncbi:death domain-associated protein 6-like [Dysidea avara]|uniref:death domain-associated protein 6-like n=1 Tax=Dysidea avara TaxID=196820 RepID=UPI003327BCF3
MMAEASSAPGGKELQDQGASGSAEPSDSKPVSAGGRQNRKQASFEYRIKKLQKKMEVYSRQIKKFNEESLSFNEMNRDDSAYMKVDALQRKLIKTWEDICRLQGTSPEIAVKYNAKSFGGTKYEELNQKINRLLDKSVDCFPDYVDILTMVTRCNTKYNLCITSEEQGPLARRIFQDVIKELKRRRQSDFVNYFGSHLTDECKDRRDPALDDVELRGVLDKHHHEGEEKMAQVIEDFVVKQEVNPQGVGEDNEEDDQDESEKESGQEEEGIESGNKKTYESDISDVGNDENSFKITLDLDKDEPIVETDNSVEVAVQENTELPCSSKTDVNEMVMDTSHTDDKDRDLTVTKEDLFPAPLTSPSPPMIIEHSPKEAVNGKTPVSGACRGPSKQLTPNTDKPQGKFKEYSYDIIVID